MKMYKILMETTYLVITYDIRVYYVLCIQHRVYLLFISFLIDIDSDDSDIMVLERRRRRIFSSTEDESEIESNNCNN